MPPGTSCINWMLFKVQPSYALESLHMTASVLVWNSFAMVASVHVVMPGRLRQLRVHGRGVTCQAHTFVRLLAVTKPAEGSPAEEPLGVRAPDAPSAVSERLCAVLTVSCHRLLSRHIICGR